MVLSLLGDMSRTWTLAVSTDGLATWTVRTNLIRHKMVLVHNTKNLYPDILKLSLWAVLTACLYGGFFVFTDSIVGFFTGDNACDGVGFFMAIDRLLWIFSSGNVCSGVGVVVTALVFSFIHGSFASHLLDVVGLKPLIKSGD